MRRRALPMLLTLGLCGASLACGAAATRGRPHSASERESPFPSRDELQELAERPVSESFLGRTYADVDSWSLAGPLPDVIGEEPIADPSPWEAVLLEATRGRAGLVVASRAMRCAAREFGRFYLEYEAYPAHALWRYILGRCGATGIELQVGQFYGALPPEASEAYVFEHWRGRAAELARTGLGTGARAAGIWFGEREGFGVVMLVSAGRRVHLEPVNAVPDDDGVIHLRGDVLIPSTNLVALVNRGRYGVQRCEPDPAVRLPRFAIACPTDRGDRVAWISLGARPPGRILSEVVLLALARPRGDEAATYRRPSYGKPAVVSSASEFNDRLLEEVNRVRKRAGAVPLALEPHESAIARRLAPLYFGSQFGALDPALADSVALGIMAGWDVEGTIRDAGVGGALALRTSDVERWLSDALEQPGLRSVLLDPARSRLAVGPILSIEHEYLAALVTTYELFGDEDPKAQRDAFYARLRREYAERGVTAPLRHTEVETLAGRYAARVRGGAMTPEEALDGLVHESVAFFDSQVGGWLLEGSSSEEVSLPDELFEPRYRRVAAAVTHYQPDDLPWGRVLVLLVAAPDAQLRTARRMDWTHRGCLALPCGSECSQSARMARRAATSARGWSSIMW